MRTLAIGIAVLATSATARADGHLFEIGLGAPAGATFGLGARTAGWQVVAEVGGGVLGPAGLVSGSVHLHRDLHAWRRYALALGVEMTKLGFLVGGGEDVVVGELDSLGPTLQLRCQVARTTQLVLDGGAVVARCRGDCDSAPFVMPTLTARLVVAI